MPGMSRLNLHCIFCIARLSINQNRPVCDADTEPDSLLRFLRWSSNHRPCRARRGNVAPTERQTTMFSQCLRSASRPLLRNVTCRKATVILPQNRSFTQTRAWKASEDIDAFAARYQNTALFKKLADKPEALAALNDFAQVLKDEGSSLTRWICV